MKPETVSTKVWRCGKCKREHGFGVCGRENAENCCVCLGCRKALAKGHVGQRCAPCSQHEWVTHARRQLDHAFRIYTDAMKKYLELCDEEKPLTPDTPVTPEAQKTETQKRETLKKRR